MLSSYIMPFSMSLAWVARLMVSMALCDHHVVDSRAEARVHATVPRRTLLVVLEAAAAAAASAAAAPAPGLYLLLAIQKSLMFKQ